MMLNGSVNLSSGRWDWSVQDASPGAIVVFRHRMRVGDEMRTWIAAPDLMAREPEENALDPVSRTWNDGFGQVWKLSMTGPPDASPLSVVFESGTRRLRASVPTWTRLGALSSPEIANLLRIAV